MAFWSVSSDRISPSASLSCWINEVISARRSGMMIAKSSRILATAAVGREDGRESRLPRQRRRWRL